ncbi:MAG: glycosyltransferase family 2 protein [Candidatus Andersenbacteria bacterium]|nr:glycosyltransferase family 2 protein [Candidatus Andersenbacteria bacterium]
MKLTIVIVNWNTGKLLKECLASLAALPEKDKIAEVIVVDNSSSDDSCQQAKAVEIGIPMTFMQLPKNIGYAAANNMALRARRDKASHVLLLNPDTQVRPGALTAGLDELERDGTHGVVGLKLVNPDGSPQPSVRSLPRLPVFLFIFLKMHRLRQQLMEPVFDYEKRAEVGQVMGAAFFINRALLEKIGLLDEKFWIWFEEVDYCKRARDAGYKVIYTPAGVVMHHGGTSFGQLVGLKKSLPLLRSAQWYVRKHIGFFPYLACALLWPVALLLSVPASLLHLVEKARNKSRL